MGLNPDQKKAVEHVNGPCLVIACPGSGKTFTVVERVVRLIEKGIQPENILCITFTNKAANEMKERVCKRLGIEKFPSFIGTIHAFCARLLRMHGKYLGYATNFTIYDTDDQKSTLRKLATERDIKLNLADLSIIVNGINMYREALLDDEETLLEMLGNDERFVGIGKDYLKFIKAHNIVDFSGLLCEAVRLLKEHESVLKRVQAQYHYIQVDEVQDTNHAQFELVELLSNKDRNLFFVGDVDQSIYAFRGARPQNIQDYLDRHPDCAQVILKVNYRSTPQIIEASSKLIEHNTDRISHEFDTANSDGKRIVVKSFWNTEVEAAWIAQGAQSFRRERELGSMAVLYRMNRMSQPIEQAMVKYRVPYKVIGDVGFYQRKEIKDIMAALRLVSNPQDAGAFMRLSDFLPGFGKVTVAKVDKICLDHDLNYIQACSELGTRVRGVNIFKSIERVERAFDISPEKQVTEIIRHVVRELDYEGHLNAKFENAEDRVGNIDQLAQSAGVYNNLDDYLQMVALMSAVDDKSDRDRISLMTVHAAKGLEFDVVFFVGFEDGVLPHGRAVAEDAVNGMAEERRIAYVGMTRAKERLLLSHCKTSRVKRGEEAWPSPFLYEAGLLEEEESYSQPHYKLRTVRR